MLRCIFLAAIVATPTLLWASDVKTGTIDSNLVPSPVEYHVLLPDGYDSAGSPLPLLLYLPGGHGKSTMLEKWKEGFDRLWADDDIPQMLVVSPTVTPYSSYADFRDGSAKWESFLVGQFLDHLREHYNVRRDRAGAMVSGWSMGGAGALRLAFRNPNVFSVVVAFEPEIRPADRWQDVPLRSRFWYRDEHFETIFGKPIDTKYWRAHNHISIAKDEPASLKKLKIYFECGNEDFLHLYEGAEYLHRVLWDNGVKHEYRSVYGADHLGHSLGGRFRNGMRFIGRVTRNEPDEVRESFVKTMKRIRELGGNPGVADVEETNRILREAREETSPD